jgi:outer membrane receptor protein involved in Fe transport
LAQQTDTLEEVVVTGSFIPRPADRPQPITVIDNEELTALNKGSIAEIFKELPQAPGSVSTINWSEGNDSPTNSVNLRGLGARGTLVLLNSRRQTIDGSSNGQGISAVDVNNLAPAIMIDRIEILTDGASALYGSDAVAGVVNFITRNNFEGAEFRASTLWNQDGDGAPEFNLGGLFGTGNGQTHIVVGFEYASTEQITSDQRYDTARLKDGFVTAFGNPGNFQNATPGGMVAGGPFPDPLCGDPSIAVSSDGVEHGFFTPGSGLCRMAITYGRSLVPDMDRFNGLAVVTHDFGNELTAQFETGFARTRGTNSFGYGLPIVASPRPFVPATNPGVIAANAADPSFAVRDYFVWFREKSSAFEQPSDQRFEQDTYRIAASLGAPIGDSSWDWELSGTYSANDTRFVDVEAIRQRLDLALAGFGGLNCNPSTGMAGVGNCQYWNPFANRMTASPGDAHFNNPEVLDWFSAGRSIEGSADLTTVDFLTTGTLGEMAGGPTGIALGAQWRSQNYANDRDDISNGGGWAFNTQSLADFSGNRETTALFGEIVMFPSDWLEVQLAARYEDSGPNDSVEPKLGLLFTPTDGLYLRATWGTSFRQASEAQSFGQTPVSGAADLIGGDQINARAQATGNVNLKPETSENLTFGITWDATDSLTLRLDYWAIDFEDLIVPESAGAILDADKLDGFIKDPRIVLLPGTPNEVCEVTRAGESPVPTAQSDPLICLSGFDVLLYDLSYINQDLWETSGVDLGVNFRSSGSGAGQWGIGFNATYVLDYKISTAGLVFDGVGSHNSRNTGTAMPEWRANLVFDWQRADHYLRASVHYVSELAEDNTRNVNSEVTDFKTLDLLYDYTLPFGDGSSILTLSVQNLTDEEDPFRDNALSTSTSKVYDVRGRRVGLAWRQTF